MSHRIPTADRLASASLKLVLAVNLVFLLSFLLVVGLATGRAHAEAPACKGQDLLADLLRTDPAAAARIEAEAAKTLNGKGLLWKIETAGVVPSYLFGTMHMTDPRVTTLSAQAQAAFDASGTLVIETTEVLDEAAMMAAMLSKPELMMFTDSTTLTSLLSPQDKAAVDKALDERGIPPSSVAKMKPWILSAMVSMPACELARKAAGVPVLDIKLARDAQAAGKAIEGLETVEQQLAAMASLPLQFHVKGLVDTLKLGDRMDDVIETMTVLYARGDIGMFWPLFRQVLPQGEGENGYAAFEQAMITNRNGVMADRAQPILAKGKAFIAVGALHLPGPDGLVERLRKAGYAVSPVL